MSCAKTKLTVQHSQDGLVSDDEQRRSLSQHLEQDRLQSREEVLVALASRIPSFYKHGNEKHGKTFKGRQVGWIPGTGV